MTQLILEIEETESQEKLVARTLVIEDTNFHPTELTWEDLRGLF